MDKPAFEITDLNGKQYRIWSDGRTEGFEEMSPCVIINRIPVEIAVAFVAKAVPAAPTAAAGMEHT